MKEDAFFSIFYLSTPPPEIGSIKYIYSIYKHIYIMVGYQQRILSYQYKVLFLKNF